MPPRGTIPRTFPSWWFIIGSWFASWPNEPRSFTGICTRCSAPRGSNLPPWLQTHMRGFRLNWEYYQQGKDRIFRDAPALIFIHAPSENVLSAQNCHLAMAHIILQAAAMGLGHLHQRILSFRSRAGPFHHQRAGNSQREQNLHLLHRGLSGLELSPPGAAQTAGGPLALRRGR